ncbi:MAG: preprotein translocase subunit SecE [Cyanobacteriota bacterium]|nr:preprotein translocase subunit SecE [Cyanobacteriota bacterium]
MDPTPAPSSTSAHERQSPPGPLEPPTNGTALEQANGFASATLAELRKVVWPSRQQLFNETVAVIVMVAVSAAAIAALDRFYGWGANLLFR